MSPDICNRSLKIDWSLLGCLHDGHGLGVVQPQRLLAENVLPRIGRGVRPPRVPGVRHRDVDGLYRGVGEQRLVAPVRALGLELLGERVGCLLLSAPDRREPAGGRGGQRRGECPDDADRPEEAPLKDVCCPVHGREHEGTGRGESTGRSGREGARQFQTRL
jgi:hypothetical protein